MDESRAYNAFLEHLNAGRVEEAIHASFTPPLVQVLNASSEPSLTELIYSAPRVQYSRYLVDQALVRGRFYYQIYYCCSRLSNRHHYLDAGMVGRILDRLENDTANRKVFYLSTVERLKRVSVTERTCDDHHMSLSKEYTEVADFVLTFLIKDSISANDPSFPT